MVRYLLRSRRKISEQIAGEPVRIGERTLRPFLRIEGQSGTGSSTSESGIGAWLRVGPEAVVVVESDGHEFRMPIRGNSRLTLWGLGAAALLAAVVSWALKTPLH